MPWGANAIVGVEVNYTNGRYEKHVYGDCKWHGSGGALRSFFHLLKYNFCDQDAKVRSISCVFLVFLKMSLLI